MRNTEQMEFGLEVARPCVASRTNTDRSRRAHWWFGQMRQVVERAMEWQPVFEPLPNRPGGLSHRERAVEPQEAWENRPE